MRICLFHPVPLPPRDYGGVERVVLWLAKGLIERGHEVFVAAAEGSRLPPGVKLIPVGRGENAEENAVTALPRGLDLVHFMAPPGDRIWGMLPCPGLVTVHGNGKPGERFPLNSVFLSRNHAERHRARCFVYNGIDPEEFRFDPASKSDWYLYLSKTSWRVKNVRGAIRYCARADAPLRVAGGNRPWLQRMRVSISPGMKWVGAVGGERKAELLARAKALVFPVVWPEPFGLVVVEALISGTPVLASRRGSLPELVPPDVGALPDSDDEWIERLRMDRLPWDPGRCREWALERFHYARMAENYETIYVQASRGEPLNPEEPVAGDWRQEQ